MSYEDVRVLAAVAGSVILASTYLVAVALTFRRRTRAAHERAARMIFDEDEQAAAKEIGRGR